MKFLAQALSVILHPLLMPTVVYATIMFIFPLSILPLEIGSKLYILGFIFLTTAILPTMCIYVMVLTGKIEDVNLRERKERLIPNIFTTIVYIFVCYLMHETMHFDGLLLNTLICFTFFVAILTAITYFWKISLHASGISGLVGFLFGLNQVLPIDNILIYCSLSLLIAGSVMTARLYLNAHTPAQIWAGAALGLLFGWITPVFFL